MRFSAGLALGVCVALGLPHGAAAQDSTPQVEAVIITVKRDLSIFKGKFDAIFTGVVVPVATASERIGHAIQTRQKPPQYYCYSGLCDEIRPEVSDYLFSLIASASKRISAQGGARS